MRYRNIILVIVMFTTLVLIMKMVYGFPAFPYYASSLPGISGNTRVYAQSVNQGYMDPFRGITGSLPDTLPTFEIVPIDPSMGTYPFGLPLGWMGLGSGGFGMPGFGYGFPWGSWPPGYGMFGMQGFGYGSGYGSGIPYITDAVTVTTQTFHKFCFPGGFCFYAIVNSE